MRIVKTAIVSTAIELPSHPTLLVPPGRYELTLNVERDQTTGGQVVSEGYLRGLEARETILLSTEDLAMFTDSPDVKIR